MKTMRFLLITLCNLILFSLTAQNTGINTASPERTLHVNGELQVDSATYIRQLFLQDNQDSSRIIFNPDSGSMEFWDNDTLWYQLKVSSPPESLTKSGNYTVKTSYEVDGFGEETEVKEYLDEMGNVVQKQYRELDPDNGDRENMFITEVYSNNCLKERFAEHAGGVGSTKIIFDCPSGDTCFIEETTNNNITGPVEWRSMTKTTNVKLGVSMTQTEKSEEDGSGNPLASSSFNAIQISPPLVLGSQEFIFGDNSATFNLFGKNNQGFTIDVEDITINIDPGMVFKN